MSIQVTSGGYRAAVLADSETAAGKRITSLELTFPRVVLAEFNTHCVLARNSASSRAIPVAKQVRKVLTNPYIPREVGTNKSGMQAKEPLRDEQYREYVESQLQDRDQAVYGALQKLLGIANTESLLGSRGRVHDSGSLRTLIGIEQVTEALTTYERYMREHLYDYDAALAQGYLSAHKQTANRNLEPFTWHTVVVTATEWSNYLALRTHKDADPAIRIISEMIAQVMDESAPADLAVGEWHAPFLYPNERALLAQDPAYWLLVSVGRCARVSYETHHGVRDTDKDRDLALSLLASGHMSPFEHVATPSRTAERSGLWAKFVGWEQLRKMIPHESDFGSRPPGGLELDLEQVLRGVRLVA